MMIDYQVQLIRFPNTSAKEAVTENSDGSYTIFIEVSLSKEAQKEAFRHAMSHITGMDFDKLNIDEIEKMAHNLELAPELCPIT